VLGRKDYTREELDRAKATISRQMTAYKRVAKSVDGSANGSKAASALDGFDAEFFNNMVLVLDRPFVHRLRMATGKDCNPLNEVELLVDALLNNRGTFRTNNVIKYDPEKTVLKIDDGEVIQLDAAGFERLSKAFFEDLEANFVAR